jgi:hypothetical protein
VGPSIVELMMIDREGYGGIIIGENRIIKIEKKGKIIFFKKKQERKEKRGKKT